LSPWVWPGLELGKFLTRFQPRTKLQGQSRSISDGHRNGPVDAYTLERSLKQSMNNGGR
jgi:hypothetical protein